MKFMAPNERYNKEYIPLNGKDLVVHEEDDLMIYDYEYNDIGLLSKETINSRSNNSRTINTYQYNDTTHNIRSTTRNVQELDEHGRLVIDASYKDYELIQTHFFEYADDRVILEMIDMHDRIISKRYVYDHENKLTGIQEKETFKYSGKFSYYEL